jgi:hypothetical protein
MPRAAASNWPPGRRQNDWPRVALALKSGNFGGIDFSAKAPGIQA